MLPQIRRIMNKLEIIDYGHSSEVQSVTPIVQREIGTELLEIYRLINFLMENGDWTEEEEEELSCYLSYNI